MTIEELRVIISARTDKLQDGINKATSKIRDFKRTSDDVESTTAKNINNMKSQYDSLVKKLDNINAKAEIQQKKLNDLREKYSRYSGVREDSPKAIKLQEQILNAENRLQNLINTSDKTVNSINELEKKMNNAGSTTESASGKFVKLKENLEQIRNKFKQTASSAESSNQRISKSTNVIARSLMTVARRIFVYNLLYKAIRGLISYMSGALKTNNQFVSSLNAIKTNLRVAFQPIYDFILPAILTLMRALATLTAYIASFINAIFGKAYEQSFGAAKGIENAKKAMDGYGGAAKEAEKKVKGALAGFDEINVLQTKTDEGDSGGGGGGDGFEMEMPDLTGIDEGRITRLQQMLAEMFKPFKDAWDNEGQNTINAAKDALDSIKNLIEAIGKSFKEVWTNGSGQEVLENILKIIQNILNFVSNLAKAFEDAWESNNVGTNIIQNIFDIFNVILGTIERITRATEEWAKTLDFTPLLNSINTLLEALEPLTQNIGDGLVWLWENALLPLAGFVITEVIPIFLNILAEALNLLNAVIEALKPLGIWLWENFLEPIAEWTGGIIISVLEGIKGALEDIGEWIKNHQTAVENIAIAVGSFMLAWKIVELATMIAGIVTALGTFIVSGGLATVVMTGFSAAIAFITSPITLAIAAIAAIIAIGVLLYKNWEEVKDKATEIWNSIKDFFTRNADEIRKNNESIWNNIKSFLVDKIWNPIKTTATNIWDSIKNYVIAKWNDIRTGISNTATALVNAIKSPFETAKKWIDGVIKDAYNWGRNLIDGFIDGIKSMVSRVGDAVRSVAKKAEDFIGFRSPTREGPGRYADKWMPNMMDMLADGIKSNTFKVENAVNMTANSLSGVQRPDNTGSIINAVTEAMSGSSGDTTIILKIGEDTITEKVVSNINRQNRINGKTVVQV